VPQLRKVSNEERLAIGQKLRQAREGAGLLQRDAAQALGISPSILCSIEQGQRRIDVAELAVISRLYGREPAWFF
jgi:transcriptional regulator with XRE-family HTH domain